MSDTHAHNDVAGPYDTPVPGPYDSRAGDVEQSIDERIAAAVAAALAQQHVDTPPPDELDEQPDDELDEPGDQAAPTKANVRMPKPKLVQLAIRAGLAPSEAQKLTKPELVERIAAADAPRRKSKVKQRAEREQHNPAQSWDDFWAARKRKRQAERGKLPTETIRGVTVVIPHDLPMGFEQEAQELQESEDVADVKALVARLFGADVFDQWVDNGMEGEEFQVVLLWGMAHGNGRKITFEQAAEAVESEGKSLMPAQNRTERRRSAKAGRSS